MDIKYIHQGIWSIFAQEILPSRYNHSWLKIIDSFEFINACKQINIDLTEPEQQTISKSTSYNHEQWMHLMKNNEIMLNAADKWRKLHSYHLKNINHNLVKATQDTLYCFQWRLPRYDIHEIGILCVGFIRKDIDKSQFIPHDIISILVYYSFENPLDAINRQCPLESGIFEIHGRKFNIVLTAKNAKA